jgi:hypothetical protein
VVTFRAILTFTFTTVYAIRYSALLSFSFSFTDDGVSLLNRSAGHRRVISHGMGSGFALYGHRSSLRPRTLEGNGLEGASAVSHSIRVRFRWNVAFDL